MRPDDAKPVEAGASASDASSDTRPDDPTARRDALRDLAAMIGVEVFY